MRYDLESTLPERAFKKSLFKNAPATLEGGKGGGGGGPTQTTSTSNVSNIPEYAQPYVETMLGATQKQLFNTDESGAITGFQPYKAYGGTYDAQGNQTSYDPSKAIAGFSPMQQQAQQSAANLQTPGQFGAATGLTGIAGMGSLQAGQNFQNMATNPNAVGAYMNPYLQASLNPQLAEIQRQYDITGQQQAGQATQQGAFGGGRDAIMAAENARNKNTAMNQAIGQGYNTAFNNAQQQMNTGAQLNLQGLNQAGQAGSSLANIGSGQLAAQQGILGTQNQLGGQQQANQQQIINQSMQDYANAQQYPIMQLGTMSNMLRGLPMQAQTTQQYQAQANPITQGIGALGAGASLYNATQPRAEGGVIKAAKGGIMSYDVGGAVRATLEDMPNESLQQQLKTTSSDTIKNNIKEILAQRNMAGVKSAKDGGVLRYAEPTEENNQSLVKPTGTYDRPPETYASPSIAADAAMYNKAGERIGNAVDYVKERINPISNLIDTGKGIINWGQKPVQQQAKEYYPELYAEKQIKNAATNGMIPTNNTTLSPDLAKQEEAYFKAPNVFGRKDGQPPTIPDETKSKVNPDSILAGAPKNKVSQNAIDIAKQNNPEFTKALGNNKPEDFSSKTLDLYKKLANELGVSTKPPVDENAGLTTAQIAAKDEEARNKFLGKNPSADRRKQIMDEKANVADEAKRTQALRMAEFFAMWGSTPGNTLVAGLNAMKNKIPDFIADRKEASKMRREIDKSIADLDQVDYLEKSGRLDAADKKRQEAIKNGLLWGTEMSKLISHVATSAIKDESDTQREHIKGKYGVTEAQIRASASVSRGGDKSSKEIDSVADNLRQTEIAIQNEKKNQDYIDRQRRVERGLPKNATPSQIERFNNDKTYVERQQDSWNTRLKRDEGRYKDAIKKHGQDKTPTETTETPKARTYNPQTGKLE